MFWFLSSFFDLDHFQPCSVDELNQWLFLKLGFREHLCFYFFAPWCCTESVSIISWQSVDLDFISDSSRIEPLAISLEMRIATFNHQLMNLLCCLRYLYSLSNISSWCRWRPGFQNIHCSSISMTCLLDSSLDLQLCWKLVGLKTSYFESQIIVLELRATIVDFVTMRV